MAEKRHGKGWNPGGRKGKLHREMGIPEDQPIPKDRLARTASKSNPDVEERNDAIRAETMSHWKKKGRRKK